MRRTLTVVCPVYNEAEVISAFHDEVRKVLESLESRYDWTLLFVVDVGTDGTLDILKRIAAAEPRVRLLALSSRFGHQMSLLAGLDHCDSDAVIMMDSDLQHPPSLLPRLLDAFEAGNDIVYTIRQDPPEISLLKRLSSRLFYWTINKIAQVPINECAADFRLVSRRVVTIFKTQIRERNQFLRGLFSWVGFRNVGIPFQTGLRAAGESKYSLMRMVRFALQGIVSFSKRPLQAAVIVGLAFAAFGLAMVVIIVFQWLTHSVLPSGWATLAVLISLFGGIQLIFLGIIGEYIGAIFDEVKGRPHYLVDEKINFEP